ncbi:BglG family transcription antiterminator [Paenibacillus sp. alder61]|uniref:BglG family transcription antiterminator n=1 Tax=Paenibacillus sp. alder61 TaxID=2862948 RepID=UPI00296EA9FB|nr:BglG family transcription antiterminator [Paenibacillus sp. alder61]
MGKFTARQRQILMFLLGRKNGVTAAEIAAETSVSVRTVHRELDDMDRSLAGFGILLLRKSGTGIALRALDGGPPEEEQLAKVREELLSGKPADYSGDERKIMLLCDLLETEEPIKMFALAHSLKVTVATVSHDLDELESELNKLGLQLVRRRGYGVEIQGAEIQKRAAIVHAASNELTYSDLVGAPAIHENAGARRLLELIGKSDLLTVAECFWDMNWPWTEELSEGAYTGLLTALSVTVNRLRRGKTVTVAEFQSGAREELEQSLLNQAGDLARHLEKTFAISVTGEETAYIASLFQRAREDSPELAHLDLEVVDIIERLIDLIVERTGIPYQEDRSLRSGLLEHIRPALKRIREGGRIRNPLLSAIRKDYEELFATVREAVDELAGDLQVPDEEIGFLVMHFGASAERLHQPGRNLRAILVCSSGLSSSRLLATRLAKEMPQIQVLGNASWYDAARLQEENYDLLISTIDLPLPGDRYVRLSPLLTREDRERLLSHIQQWTLQKRRPPETGELLQKEGAMARLGTLNATLSEIHSLLQGFGLYELNNEGAGLGEIVTEALELVNGAESASGGKLIADIPAVAERLLERERLATQMIPGTALALFHTRSPYIRARALSLFRLKSPLALDSEGEAKVILLMLAPQELSKESLEVLSEISALLLNSQLVSLLESGTDAEIRNYLAAELLSFFENNG